MLEKYQESSGLIREYQLMRNSQLREAGLLCEETIIHGNFEWEREKDELNYAQHELRFENVLSVFGDPHRVNIDHLVRGELRYLVIGRQQGRRNRNLYVVVFTWRGNRKRIISARKAQNSERNFYNRRRWL